MDPASYIENLTKQINFQEFKEKNLNGNEVYLIEIAVQDVSNPQYRVQQITNDIKYSQIQMQLNSPQQSQLQAVALVNETEQNVEFAMQLNADIGQNHAFGMVQFNYADFQIQNPQQLSLIVSQNEHIQAQNHNFTLQPQSILLVFVGQVSAGTDPYPTQVHLTLGSGKHVHSHKKKDSSMTYVLILLVVLVLLAGGYVLYKNKK